jgi:hypothetical protein
MRIKVTKTKVYQFDELTDDQQQKAIERLYDINVDYEWWDFIYNDANIVKLKLTGFDIGRRSYCKGEFIEYAEDTAQAILKHHGDCCDTYQTAKNYLHERTELVKKHSDGKNTAIVTEDNEYEFDNDCEALDAEFLKDILEDYRIILQKEYEYLTSEKAIIETIKLNDYEFDIDGNLA